MLLLLLQHSPPPSPASSPSSPLQFSWFRYCPCCSPNLALSSYQIIRSKMHQKGKHKLMFFLLPLFPHHTNHRHHHPSSTSSSSSNPHGLTNFFSRFHVLDPTFKGLPGPFPCETHSIPRCLHLCRDIRKQREVDSYFWSHQDLIYAYPEHGEPLSHLTVR